MSISENPNKSTIGKVITVIVGIVFLIGVTAAVVISQQASAEPPKTIEATSTSSNTEPADPSDSVNKDAKTLVEITEDAVDNFSRFTKSFADGISTITGTEVKAKAIPSGEDVANAFAGNYAKSFNVASHAYGSQAAVDAGGIVEYQPGLYVSHNYDEGAAFLNFNVGDVVSIDGYTVTIDGYFYIDTDTATNGSIRAQAGYDTVCFQTCTGGGSEAIIYYGHVPGANFDTWYCEDGSTMTEAQYQNDLAYNAEGAALDAEFDRLCAEYDDAYAAYVAGVEALDTDAIKTAMDRLDACEVWEADLNARYADHNARF